MSPTSHLSLSTRQNSFLPCESTYPDRLKSKRAQSVWRWPLHCHLRARSEHLMISAVLQLMFPVAFMKTNRPNLQMVKYFTSSKNIVTNVAIGQNTFCKNASTMFLLATVHEIRDVDKIPRLTQYLPRTIHITIVLIIYVKESMI